MARLALALLVSAAICDSGAAADYRITRDYGGLVEQYKIKYAAIRGRGDRVIIDGICNSACTLVLGIVPMNRICVTSRASLGFHIPYYAVAATDGIIVPSYEGAADLMSYYPQAVKDWLERRGGLTSEIKTMKKGPELMDMVDPCPERSFQ
jgi:hypothetical protein